MFYRHRYRHHHRPPGEPGGASVEELNRWLGYIEAHIDHLASLSLSIHPAGSPAYREARLMRVRLQFFLNVLRVKLGLRTR